MERGNPAVTVLSARQIECLLRISRGETSAEIAIALGLSRHTVDHYIGGACAKLGAKTRAQAVAIAIAQQQIPAPPAGDGAG
jgi:DNA-binding CsgD family transcriptional regulator